MTLDELKTELEKRTEFRFEKMPDYFYNARLTLSGLSEKTTIKIDIGNEGVGIFCADKRRSLKRFSVSGQNIDEIIEWLNSLAPKFGWKPSNLYGKQWIY